MFLKVLNLKQEQGLLPSTGKIKEMNLYQCNSAAAHLLLDNMSHLLVFRKLTHLVMTSGCIGRTTNHLSKQTELLQQLECLQFTIDRDCDTYEYENLLRKADIEPEAGNKLNPGGVAVNLIKSLTKFSTIRELHLSDTGIGFEDCKVLGELLASSGYIKVLDISDNNLSPDSIQLNVDGLSHNTSLEKLDMRRCSIQGEGAVCLANAMERNSTLREFNIDNNPIGSEGAVAFASMLKKNQCLRKLWLNHSSVGVEGALVLIGSLKHNTTLEKLKLSEKCKPPSFSTLDKTLQDRVTFAPAYN